MKTKTKTEYTTVMTKRYKKTKKITSKKIILDEYCQTVGCRRKHAIRKLNNYKFFTKPKHKKPGSPSISAPYECIIFSHDFAKAIWGKHSWEIYLQEMVLEEEPIEFLEGFI